LAGWLFGPTPQWLRGLLAASGLVDGVGLNNNQPGKLFPGMQRTIVRQGNPVAGA
jgi:hypothetical protein